MPSTIEPSKQPDTIDWDLVPTQFNYLVRGRDGSLRLFEEEPVLNYGILGWEHPHDYGQEIPRCFFDNFKITIGGLPWDQSIIERPNND